MSRDTFLLAAGGTGGHVYPALAVAEAVRALRPRARIHFVGGRRGIEGRLVRGASFPLTRLPATGLRGAGVVGRVRFALAFGAACAAALVLLARLRPDVVLATGGYASAAPALTAALLGRPLWLQEQNAVPGSANRFLSRWAERAYVAFEEASGPLARAREVVHLPNPVRASIFATRGEGPRSADFEGFGLAPHRPTVLVFGGSRGARSLNRAVREAWPSLAADSRWQLLVQAGHEEADALARHLAARESGRVAVHAFLEDMAAAYRVADVVVCRAGALTLAELAAAGKPALLVPYPHATDDHQMHNALAFEAAGAADVVPDAELTGARLASWLLAFEQDPGRRTAMADAAAGLTSGRDGAHELARALVARAEEGRPS